MIEAISEWVIVKKSEFTSSMISSNNTYTVLPNGQYLIRATLENEDKIVGFKRFVKAEIDEIRKSLNLAENKECPVTFSKHFPFPNRALPDGRSIFRRKHGLRDTVLSSSNKTILFVVPYDECRIDKIEIINCTNKDFYNIKVYDTPTGLISGTPDKMLSQFAYNANLSDSYYVDSSNYDATIFKDMTIEIDYFNNDIFSKEIGVNYNLHEIRTSTVDDVV